jgi:O-antigen/teichoic acid export membrane protein
LGGHRHAVARNALWLVLGQAVSTTLAIVLSAALGRSLGAADFGVYYLVTSITTLAFVFVEWGPSQVVRDVAREPAAAGRLLGTTLAWRAGAAVVAGIAATAVAWLLGYDSRTLGLGAVVMAATLPLALAQAHGLVFRAVERMDDDAAVTVTGKVLIVALTLPALALGGGLLSVLLAQGGAALVALGVAFAIYRRRRLPALATDLATLRTLFWGGLPLLTLSLAIYGQNYFDAVILSKLGSARAVGWYAAARNFTGTLIVPATILASASYPRLSRMAQDPTAFSAEVRAALRPVLGLGALAAAGTWLFADLAVSLVYGRAGFAPAIDVLRLSSPVIFLFFIDVLLGMSIIAAGRERAFSIAKVVSVGVAVAADLLLVPWCEVRFGNGGLGVVLASLVSEVVMCGAALLIAPLGTVNRGLLLDMGRAILAGAGAVLIGLLLSPLHDLVRLPVAVGGFVALAFALGLARRGDLGLLRSLLRRERGSRPPSDTLGPLDM